MSASVGYLTYPLCGRGSKESPDVAEALSLPKLEKRGLSKGLKSYDKAGGWNFLLAGHRRQCIRDIRENKLGFSPNRNCWGPLLRRKRNAPGAAEFGWVARGFGAGGPRSLDGWQAALELGARGVWMLDGWHAAQELAQELGARGVWMGGTRLFPRLWMAVVRRWMGGTRAGSPRTLDGWHAAQDSGAWGPAIGWHAALELGVWMVAQLWGWGRRSLGG